MNYDVGALHKENRFLVMKTMITDRVVVGGDGWGEVEKRHSFAFRVCLHDPCWYRKLCDQHHVKS